MSGRARSRGWVLRVSAWAAGVVLAALAYRWAAGVPSLREYPAMAGLAVFGAAALGAEVLDLALTLRGAGRRTAPRDLRPPDGQYEIQPIVGSAGAPLPRDGRFRRFERFDGPAPDEAGPPGDGSLAGRVVLVSYFVGRFGLGWQEDEVAGVLRALGRVAGWVEREAARWAATVNVDLADTIFVGDDPADESVVVQFQPEGDHLGPMEADAATKAIAGASRAAAGMGFVDAIELVRSVRSRLPMADRVVWMMHVRAGGRSLAIPAAESPVPGVALAVCYAREASFPEPLDGPPFPDPTTYAHEMLHLFGATDKYAVPLSSYPRGMVSERDIMVLHERALGRLRVDRLTAVEIGWAGA